MKLAIALVFLIFSNPVFAVKNFVYCSEGSPSGFNPQVLSDGSSFNASSQTIYNRLVEFKIGTTETQPALAESWTISKDGLKYQFKIRKGVSFHSTEYFTPSRDLNAEDVVYSFKSQLDPQHPLSIPSANYEYFKAMEMDQLIADVRKIDEYTVEFILKKKEAPFIANLAMDFASILSAEYAQKIKNSGGQLLQLAQKPIGTGPFIFKGYQKDSIIRFVANEKYFRGKPKIENLIFAITPDASVRTQKLKVGECHLIAEPAFSDLEALMKDPKVKVMEQEGLNVGYVAMNVTKKPFDNLKVREAMNYALDRENYLRVIFLNKASLSINPIPPSMWGYNKGVQDIKLNREKAKKLLAEAGYPNGFEAEMWVLPVSRPYNPAGKKMGELMQADLAAVGIKLKLVSFDWPTYLEKSKKGEHSLVQFGWTGDNGDPDNFFNVLLGCAAVKAGSNFARWCDPDFDKLIEEAKANTNQKERAQFYQKAQVIFKKQLPWVNIAHAKVYRAMSPKVKGFKIHPFGLDSFYEVDLQ